MFLIDIKSLVCSFAVWIVYHLPTYFCGGVKFNFKFWFYDCVCYVNVKNFFFFLTLNINSLRFKFYFSEMWRKQPQNLNTPTRHHFHTSIDTHFHIIKFKTVNPNLFEYKYICMYKYHIIVSENHYLMCFSLSLSLRSLPVDT